MLTITHQCTCPLYGTCRYPHVQSHVFLPKNTPCSKSDRCEVETAVHMDSPLHTLDRAEELEQNLSRFVISWHCICKRCRLGYKELCYAKRGPDPELRKVFWERWRVQQLRDARRNLRKN